MPRGDGREEYRFADGEDDSEDLGYGGGAGGGGRKYDDDDDDEGGWATHRETDDLWDSTDEMEEDEEAVEGAEPVIGAETEDEDEDAFGRPAARPSRPAARGGASAAAARPASA